MRTNALFSSYTSIQQTKLDCGYAAVVIKIKLVHA